MLLQPIEKVEKIRGEDFQQHYCKTNKPVVITDLAKQWPAYSKWTWEYFKEIVGEQQVGIYNNVKSDAYTPVNRADEYTSFAD